MPDFIPGLELNRRFYHEVLGPSLHNGFPDLPYSAALIGSGSEVLGFDDQMSTDHSWGICVRLFVGDQDAARVDEIRDWLRLHLPHEFLGYGVDGLDYQDDPGNWRHHIGTHGPVDHRIHITTLRQLLKRRLGLDIDSALTPADWLTIPSQMLRELTAGEVYHDGLGRLTELRGRFKWYPHDVWLYLLAAGWQRIGQEEHLMPRAGYAGDELGSALIGSRLVRDVINLCFLMERQYAPYPKWFGTAFKQLGCARDFMPALLRAQLAPTWQERMSAIGEAFQGLARLHNSLSITPPMPETVSAFHTRPFTVVHGDRFREAIVKQIQDPAVARIAEKSLIGSIDQWSDSTDIRFFPSLHSILREFFSDASLSGQESL